MGDAPVRAPDTTEVVGVSRQTLIPVYVDSNFTTEDDVSIFLAIDAWNTALQGHVYLDIITMGSTFSDDVNDDVERNHGLEIIRATEDFPVDPRPRGAAWGWADYIGGTRIWLVRKDIPNRQLTRIVMHEIGHTLGAMHTDTPGLMYRFCNVREQWSCVDLATASQVTSYFGLPLTTVKHCEHDL